MNGRIFIVAAAMALGTAFTATLVFSQAPAGGPQSLGWFLQGTAPDPGGRLAVGPGGRVIPAALGNRGGLLTACVEDAAKFCNGQTGLGARACLTQNSEKLSAGCKTAVAALPPAADSCIHSPVCDNPLGGTRAALQRVEWKQTMGFTYAYPVDLPQGGGGASAVQIDSKGNMWVFQRNALGKPQLFEFGPDRNLIRTVGDEVIGHQEKAHGMAIDAEDNVWICDANGATVMKLVLEGNFS
jgi:hypothetical protein